MTDDRVITRADLSRILRSNRPINDRQSIVELLRVLDVDEFALKAIPARELQATYERRRTRMPDAHPLAASVDRLLAALKNYGGADVFAVILESSRYVAVVWLTESNEAVLSTLVDHRDG